MIYERTPDDSNAGDVPNNREGPAACGHTMKSSEIGGNPTNRWNYRRWTPGRAEVSDLRKEHSPVLTSPAPHAYDRRGGREAQSPRIPTPYQLDRRAGHPGLEADMFIASVPGTTDKRV